MTYSQDQTDDFVIRIPRAGAEAAAIGGAVAVDLNGTPADGFFGDAIENTGGGVLTYAIYQTALTAIRTEGYVRQNQMTRREQFAQVKSTAWEATKGGVVASVVIGCALAACPWLMPIASVGAIVGGAVAGTRIINAAMDSFSPEMKTELKAAATEAGLTIKGLTDGDDTTTPAPAGA